MIPCGCPPSRTAAQVVDPKPGFKKVVNNFSGKDYQTMGLTTVLSMPFGYFAGMHALSVFISRLTPVLQRHCPHKYPGHLRLARAASTRGLTRDSLQAHRDCRR